MTDFTDDPRLTAYALGELQGDELREVETLVASNADARRMVEEIRVAASVVAAELGGVAPEFLTADQRAAIGAKAGQPKPVLHVGRVRWIVGATAAAAAAFVVGTMYGSGTVGSKRTAEVADASAAAGSEWKPVEPGTLRGGYPTTDPGAATPYVFGGGGGGSGGIVLAGKARPADVKAMNFALSTTRDEPVTKDGVTLEFVQTPTVTNQSPPPGAAFAPLVGGAGGGAGGIGRPAAGGFLPKVHDFTFAAGLDSPSFEGSTESYSHIEDNPFRLVKDTPLSTFGADVDTASYANVRRMLTSGRLPPPGAIRIEEMVNYFPYDYAPPTDGRPFAVRIDVAACPWKMDHRLVRIGLKGRVVATQERPAANLVFLLDVSGSMQPENRLPLVLQSMKLLVEKLTPRDRVAIVVYAGESGLALPSTSCENKGAILAALDALHAGGSTNGAAGIQLAYDIAQQNRIEGGVNRVILATDGDFNVGLSDESSLVKLIEEKRKSGTFLSVLGVGDDNFQDSKMEMLADRGNGNYAYLDTIKEGQKALGDEVNATLVTIAKDVKVQVEFNPAQVGSWRLIGYEDRVLAAEDFKDDRKDAGDIGAGHTVTALYEVVPPGAMTQTAGVEPLKYQTPPAPVNASRELLNVKLRWKEPNSDVSTPMEVAVVDEGMSYSAASADFKFAASVAAFGMCLRNSPNKGDANLPAVLELATEGAANDRNGLRREFVDLVKKAIELGAK